ncbi:PREDICTED: long-chain fatty acid transport protein 4-like isoform X2 [Amphimedon queenslandica]|uniref:Very long-chain fatty acid transport protein n=1 Tax=Amphimedon queenslandica TaxID=400682 RepID=A0A1X7UHS2_AMPQE|nr:PREDICTED: long-chain fatty acid transport protein 4-like isoform X2 [Amphimedon queenslandica]|eukprot:XP_019854267.1 PREDICTED: long-chain fatty acid transport protein 4-like isoform X2 [Amphimedon queenslandica]
MGALRALLLSVSAGLGVYLMLSFPGWLAGALGLLGFLGLGGWPITRIAIKTLPRDLRAIVKLSGMARYIRGWSGKRVSDVFQSVASSQPESTAILFEEQKWTYRDLDNYSNQIANLFQDAGVKPNETVVMVMQNSPQFIGVALGLSKIGATGSFINFNLRGNALVHCIKICNPVAVIFDAPFSDAINDIRDQIDARLQDLCFSINGDDSNKISRSFDTEVRKMPTDPPPPLKEPSSNSKFCFIYTSGTTGLPKAVPIRHQKYMTMATSLRFGSGMVKDDVIYCALPLYHTNGGILGAGQMLLYGNAFALRRKFSASNFWNDCIKYKCTVIQYIGEFCRYLLVQPPKPTDKQHLVRMATGNGLRPHIWQEFKDRFNIQIIAEFYGSTEGNANMLNMEGVVGSCGFKSMLVPPAIPVYLVKVDPETEELVKDSNGFCVMAEVGEKGELVGRIKNNFLRRFDGYENKEATNKKILTGVFSHGDRFFRTGDMMIMDTWGNFYFADRTGDTFRWKGENVSTSEVETLMAKAVKKEIHIAVFGVDVANSEGKAGMGVVEGDPEAIDVTGGLAGGLYEVLPSYAVPLFLRFVKEIEMTGTHKYKKTSYRKEGYDPSIVSDPLFVLDVSKKVYVPLTQEILEAIKDGKWRV